MRALSLVLCSWLVMGTAHADGPQFNSFVDGNMLLSWCEANVARNQLSKNYIVGIFDAVDALHVWGNDLKLCVNEGVNADQLNDIACGYLKEHPEKRHFTAGTLVITSIAEKFPC